MTVLAFVGPGIGHYTPLASYLHDCALDEAVVMVGDVAPDSALAKRIVCDGYRYEQLPYARRSPLPSRVVRKLHKRSFDRAISALATHLPSREMPHLAARSLFALYSVTRSIETVSPQRAEAARRLVREHRPSIVFADTVSWDLLPAVLGPENVPWVLHEVCPVNSVVPGRPRYPAGLSPSLPGAEAAINRATGVATDLRKARIVAQLERLAPGYAQHEHARPFLKIAFTCAALDDYSACAQSEFSYVGVSSRELERVSVPPRPDGRRVIYVSLGSTGVPASRRLYETVIDGFRERSAHLVLQIVDDEIAAEIAAYAARSAGSSLEIQRAFFGHPSELLSRADLVIGHGGNRTVVEALSFGVPVLVIPNIAADRLEVARRVIEHGCGGSLNYHRLTPDEVGREAWRLLESAEIKAAALRMREQMLDTRERDRTTRIVRERVQRARASAT